MMNERITPMGEPVKRQKNGVWKVTDRTVLECMNALYDASERNREQGYIATADYQLELKATLYEMLASTGYFDDIWSDED